MQKQLNHLNRGPIKQLHTVELPLSREEAVILEAAHLNLHQKENLYGHGWKTFHVSRMTTVDIRFCHLPFLV